MKRFKKISLVFTAILLAGFVTLSACKKDDDDDKSGAEVGKEYCDCITNADDDEKKLEKCEENIEAQMEAHENDLKFLTDILTALAECTEDMFEE